MSSAVPAFARAVTSGKNDEHLLVRTLQKVDPVLQFLTRATGQTAVAAPTFFRAIPDALFDDKDAIGKDLQQLVDLGILSCFCKPANINEDDCLYSSSRKKKQRSSNNTSTTAAASALVQMDDGTCWIGFPEPNSHERLHGSTKAAAKRRLAALKQRLISKSSNNNKTNCNDHDDVRKSDKEESNTSTTKQSEVVMTVGDDQDYSKVALSTDDDVDDNDDEKQSSLHDEELTSDRNGGRLTPEIVEKCDTDIIQCSKSDTGNCTKEESAALQALTQLFGFKDDDDKVGTKKGSDFTSNAAALPSTILPKQASYAGSNPAQVSKYANLSRQCLDQIPTALLKAFGLLVHSDGNEDDEQPSSSSSSRKQLFSHQVAAIEATMKGQHCSVCTGTGSGKSLCFLLPVLTAAYNDNHTSLLLFPTKALAQDQLSKIMTLLATDAELSNRIRPATLDGDTPHSVRSRIGQECNVILTNPDTLHAAILPSWKSCYQSMLASLRYCVVDESHTYDGVFGAHCAMILRRLVRVGAVAAAQQADNTTTTTKPPPVTFFAASATLPWPEHHFRLLCPVPKESPVKVLTSQQDGSPRSAKHFFVWNPPILNMDGTSTGKVQFPRQRTKSSTSSSSAHSTISGKIGTTDAVACSQACGRKRARDDDETGSTDDLQESVSCSIAEDSTMCRDPAKLLEFQLRPAQIRADGTTRPDVNFHRRHAAEETARLLAKAVANGTRCIAFCKTRNLVEWVYSKALDVLKNDTTTAHLVSRVESYRGGYRMAERRKIEERLFNNEILGVVGTNALELGVDLGGIDVTLHCGYPSSYASLLQQAGRAGRGKERNAPSVSVVVCLNSPAEQQIWRRPQSLLGKGLTPPNTIPMRGDLVQSHLLCGCEEFPLSGENPVTAIVGSVSEFERKIQSDRDLFGLDVYDQAMESLQSTGSLVEESVAINSAPRCKIVVYKARASLRKAWSRVSIRAIEPVNYAVVDLSHPGQGGRTDKIHDDSAVLDVLPYSRVFFHAHPGSIITHRAKKYKIVAMTRPPAFVADNFSYRRSLSLAAFAKPTNARYITRPLSKLHITVVKQLESVELQETARVVTPADTEESSRNSSQGIFTFAGCGAVSVKREVHGYKKLSAINRCELSRAELSLPPIEYDTFGLYLCADPGSLAPVLGEKFGPGVHALSHALLAVAPLFASGLTRSDLECDHSFYSPTQVILFDERAGGSGCVERLWGSFFQPKNNILEAAIGLLEDCSSCGVDSFEYDGGCPACLHAPNCIKFNMHLSRSAAIIIGKRMLERIKTTKPYLKNVELCEAENNEELGKEAKDVTPRRKARRRAMQRAKEMGRARDRQFVVGRPSWPLDDGHAGKQEQE